MTNCRKKLFPGLVALMIVFTALGSFAQSSAKKELTIKDYDKWRTISSTSISDNGEWVSYAYILQKADDTLYIKSLI